MTRSRFFSSSDDRKGEPSEAHAAAAAAAPISTTQLSTTPGSTTSSTASSSSRWRRPRLRRSHAHQFSEVLLAEKPVAIAPALSRDSLGSGYTEAPSSRGTSAETLSACSPAAGLMSQGSLQVDDFDLDAGCGPSSCEEDDLSWLDEDMPPSEDGVGGAAGDSDGEFDEFVHHQHQPQQQRQRYSGPLELCVQDFECGECIGKGSYSRVYLGNHAPTRTEWALKVVSKRKTFETRENLAHLREEKYISTKLQGSDFLVRTAGTFQNPRSVVFAMEYLPGGDLYQRLSDKGTLSLGEAVAWTAQAVLAIEDLHGKNIVHRDIKPENFLMGKSGTLKLTDFGFARELEPDERLYSQFGTPEYVAPEVLNGCGHGTAVDLWALGVLIYELLVGQTPFKSSTVDEMYERIAAGDYSFPAPPVTVARKRIGSTQKGSSTKSSSKSNTSSGKKAAAAKSSPLCSHVQQKVGAGLKRGMSFKKTGSQVAAAMAAAVADAGLEDDQAEGDAVSSGNNGNSSSSSSSSAEKRQREQQRQSPTAQPEKPRRHHQQNEQQEVSGSRHRQPQDNKAANTKSGASSKSTTASVRNNRPTGSAAQDPAAQSLVKALLCLSPSRRPTLAEIKCHPFFAGVDFAGLRAAVRAQAEQEEEDAVVSAAIDGGDVWVRGQPVVCRSEELDDNYGGVFEGF